MNNALSLRGLTRRRTQFAAAHDDDLAGHFRAIVASTRHGRNWPSTVIKISGQSARIVVNERGFGRSRPIISTLMSGKATGIGPSP
jgi:tRNA A37 threonylcarbamoyladenosine synthetase subunit TsaC/SUA5/YrdC